jgi:hypothetical protein
MTLRTPWWFLALAAACGGGAVEEAGAPEPVAPRRQAQADSTAQAQEDRELRREVYSYSGGPRDPFESLLETANIGPELPDLSLVAIYVDHGNTDRSVATLRERVTGKRYNLHPGDRLGRLRVADIRERDVDFLIDDFGTVRRETLSLRRPQEEQTP